MNLEDIFTEILPGYALDLVSKGRQTLRDKKVFAGEATFTGLAAAPPLVFLRISRFYFLCADNVMRMTAMMLCFAMVSE